MKARVLTLLLGLALACLAAADQLQRVETTVDAMGTTYSIIAYGGDVGLVKAAVEDAAEEARRLDALLSNYLPASEWSQVNAQASKRAVRVSPELFQLIAQCVEYSKASEGAFDITVGPLMKVWGFYKGTGRLPKREEVRAALERVGYRNILLDPKNNTVRFAREGVEIDPGGIGKGYAVDKMIEVLKADGITSAMVSAGGSSIYGLGTPPDERGWRTVIRDPKDANKTAAEVWLKDESLSTSERMSALQKALEIDPNNFESTYAMGEFYRYLSWQAKPGFEAQAHEAMQWFARTIELNPYDPYAPLRYGMCLDWSGQPRRSTDWYRRAIYLDPNNPELLAYMGWHYIQMEDYMLAKSWLERAQRTWWTQLANDYLELVNEELAKKR